MNTIRTCAGLLALALLARGQGAVACDTETRDIRGQRHTGCFVGGELEGSGTVAFPNGDRYAGDFARGLRDGQGTMVFADGRRYEGAWAADRPHGRGTFTEPGGNRYEGEYRNGRREGHGVMTTQGGASRYEGGWLADKEHGHGHRRFGDGREYIGEYARGRPHGNGVLRALAKINRPFIGLSSRLECGIAIIDGQFILARALSVEGTRFEGRFERGQLVGAVIVTLPDGTTVPGRMAGGQFVPDA